MAQTTIPRKDGTQTGVGMGRTITYPQKKLLAYFPVNASRLALDYQHQTLAAVLGKGFVEYADDAHVRLTDAGRSMRLDIRNGWEIDQNERKAIDRLDPQSVHAESGETLFIYAKGWATANLFTRALIESWIWELIDQEIPDKAIAYQGFVRIEQGEFDGEPSEIYTAVNRWDRPNFKATVMTIECDFLPKYSGWHWKKLGPPPQVDYCAGCGDYKLLSEMETCDEGEFYCQECYRPDTEGKE